MCVCVCARASGEIETAEQGRK